MPGPVPGESARRLFFALWPDNALRAAAARLGERLPQGLGRVQRPDQLHVTLVFLGAVPARRLAEVRAAADEVRGAAITLELDRLEHWREPKVLCLVASVVPPALADLVAALRSSLARRQFPGDTRAYRPHLTLARKVASFEAGQALPPLTWTADSFMLVESVSGSADSRYLPLTSWPLRPVGSAI